MESEVIYKLSQKDFEEVIEKSISKQVEDRIFNRFESTTINAKTACHILRISAPTMHTYIKAGHLIPEDRVSGGDIYFSLSQILKFDKAKVQQQIRYGSNYLSNLIKTKS
jgi:hypothetical protein